MEVLSVQST